MGRDILTETFISISRTFSFSKTAEELGISQQAVSKNIARLESNLGFSLLNRNSHRVSLTPWGKQYLEANVEFSEKIKTIKELFQANTHSIRLQTLNQPEFDLLKSIPSIYISELDADITIDTTTTQPDASIIHLLNDQTDLVITLERFMTDNELLSIYPVFSFEMCFLVAKNHPLYHEGVDYRVFRNEPFVAGTTLDTFFGESISFVQKDIEAFDLEPAYIIMQTNAKGANTKAAEECVAQGTGIIVGASMFRPYEEKNLALVPTGKFNQIVGIWKSDTKKTYIKNVVEYISNLYKQNYSLI